jgi:hypothetical protein
MKGHINKDAKAKIEWWSGYKGMQAHFPKLVLEKSGKKDENFKQVYWVIMMFKAKLRSALNLVRSFNPTSTSIPTNTIGIK